MIINLIIYSIFKIMLNIKTKFTVLIDPLKKKQNYEI